MTLEDVKVVLEVVARGVLGGLVVLVSLYFAYAFGAGYIPLGPFGIFIALGVLLAGGVVVRRLLLPIRDPRRA